jgi:adenylyltransferase/sulfurtransferase
MAKRDEFTDEELEYYSRQLVIREFGLDGQLALKKARVLVAGLGGLGSPISLQLAAMGVGELRIVDRDIVEISNLQRQHLYTISDLGYPKAEVAEDRLIGINPFIEIDAIPTSINEKTVKSLIEGIDLVVDGLDNIRTRYILNRICVERSIPFIHGAVMTQVGNVTTIIPGETPCLECFQGGLEDEELESCAVTGVIPNIINIIASIEVNEAIRLIQGREPNLKGKLLHCDLDDLTFETISIKRVETCPICGEDGEKPHYPKFRKVEEICGRDGKRVYIINPDEMGTIDISDLKKNLLDLGFSVTVSGRLGIKFEGEKIQGSLMITGSGVVEGVEDKEEAIELYNKLVQKF